MKYVASLSTIPSRVEHLHFTLDSLQNQSRPFDKIYLCIPHECKRLGKPYIIPDSLMSRRGIEILRCDDYGPATKLLGLLAANLPEITPDTKIFFCDDDRVYESTRAEEFWKASEEYPEFVICTASTPYWKFFVDGQIYDYNSEKDFPAGRHKIRDGYMDIFEGFGGVLTKPRFMDATVFEIPSEFRVVDDIWLSGCSKKGGRKIWGLNLAIPVTHKGDAVDPLWALKGEQDRKVCNPRCIAYMRKTYKIWNNVESLSLDNNIVIPTTPSAQRLHGLMRPILDHLKIPMVPPISVQRPETYIAEVMEDVDAFTSASSALDKLTGDLVPLCERFGTMLHDYKTATRFFVDHKLDIPESLDAPLNVFLTESDLPGKLEEYITLHQEVRGWVLRATVFKRRLFCHVCQHHIYHFVSTPCGHLSCDECKGTVCKVCGKQTTGVHPVAF